MNYTIELQKPKSTSYAVIKVLPVLIGRTFNLKALDLIHSLRPSILRVTSGEVKCDSYLWRVTITIDNSNVIKDIVQEVEVSCDSGFEHGHALMEYFYDK